MDTAIKEALSKVRSSTEELNTAIRDAAARQGGVIKADLQAAGERAKVIADSIKLNLSAQNDTAKQHLNVAMTSLEAIQRHAEAALRDSGEAFLTAFQQTQDEARACMQEVSAAMAQKHTPTPPKAGNSAG